MKGFDLFDFDFRLQPFFSVFGRTHLRRAARDEEGSRIEPKPRIAVAAVGVHIAAANEDRVGRIRPGGGERFGFRRGE